MKNLKFEIMLDGKPEVAYVRPENKNKFLKKYQNNFPREVIDTDSLDFKIDNTKQEEPSLGKSKGTGLSQPIKTTTIDTESSLVDTSLVLPDSSNDGIVTADAGGYFDYGESNFDFDPEQTVEVEKTDDKKSDDDDLTPAANTLSMESLMKELNPDGLSDKQLLDQLIDPKEIKNRNSSLGYSWGEGWFDPFRKKENKLIDWGEYGIITIQGKTKKQWKEEGKIQEYEKLKFLYEGLLEKNPNWYIAEETEGASIAGKIYEPAIEIGEPIEGEGEDVSPSKMINFENNVNTDGIFSPDGYKDATLKNLNPFKIDGDSNVLAVISEWESEKFNDAFWPWYTEQAEYKSTIKPQIDQLEEDFFDDKIEGFSGSLVTKTIQDAIDKEFGPSIRRKSEKLDTEYQEVRKKLEEDFAKKFPNGSCDRGVPSISQYRAGLKSGQSQRIFATDCFKKEDVDELNNNLKDKFDELEAKYFNDDLQKEVSNFRNEMLWQNPIYLKFREEKLEPLIVEASKDDMEEFSKTYTNNYSIFGEDRLNSYLNYFVNNGNWNTKTYYEKIGDLNALWNNLSKELGYDDGGPDAIDAKTEFAAFFHSKMRDREVERLDIKDEDSLLYLQADALNIATLISDKFKNTFELIQTNKIQTIDAMGTFNKETGVLNAKHSWYWNSNKGEFFYRDTMTSRKEGTNTKHYTFSPSLLNTDKNIIEIKNELFEQIKESHPRGEEIVKKLQKGKSITVQNNIYDSGKLSNGRNPKKITLTQDWLIGEIGRILNEEVKDGIEQALRYNESIQDATLEDFNDSKSGARQFLEGLVDGDWWKSTPIFMGHILASDGREIKNLIKKQASGQKLTALETYTIAMASYDRQLQGLQENYYSHSKKGGAALKHSLSWLTEFAMLSAASAPQKAIINKVIKTSFTKNMSNLAIRKGVIIDKVTKKPLKNLTFGLEVMGDLIGYSTITTSALGFVGGRINQTFQDLATPEFSAAFNEVGELKIFGTGEGGAFETIHDSTLKLLAKSYGTTWSELITEAVVGRLLMFGGGKFLNRGKDWTSSLKNKMIGPDTQLGKLVNSSKFKQKFVPNFIAYKYLQWASNTRKGLKGFQRWKDTKFSVTGLNMDEVKRLVAWQNTPVEFVEELFAAGFNDGILGNPYSFLKWSDDGKLEGLNYDLLGQTLMTVGAMGIGFNVMSVGGSVFSGPSKKSKYEFKYKSFKDKKSWLKAIRESIKNGDITKNTDIYVNNDFTALEDARKLLNKNNLDQDLVKTPNLKERFIEQKAVQTELLSIATKEQADKIKEIDAEIQKISSEKITAKGRKKINQLNRLKNNILAPIKLELLKNPNSVFYKNKELYKSTLKEVKNIVKNTPEFKGLKITEASNSKQVEKIWLKKLGFKRNRKGQLVQISTGKVVTTMDVNGKLVNIENYIQESTTAHGMFLPTKNGYEIIINEDLAVTTGGANVASHEFFHFYLNHITKKNPKLKLALGHTFFEHLKKIDPKTVLDSGFRKRLETYNNSSYAIRMEESMTLFLDALATGSLQYNESMMDRVGNVFQNIASSFGANLELTNGKQVLNFIKEFNTSIKEGKFSDNLINKIDQGLVVGGEIAQIVENLEQQESKHVRGEVRKIKKALKSKGVSNNLIKVYVDLIKEKAKEEGVTVNFSKAIEDLAKESDPDVNADIYNTLNDLFQTYRQTDPSITIKQVWNLPENQDLKKELIKNNLNLVVQRANVADKVKSGLTLEEKKKVKRKHFVSGFATELATLANTWDPGINPDFVKYASPLLKVRYNQIKNEAIDKAEQEGGPGTVGLQMQTSEGLIDRPIADVRDKRLEDFESQPILQQQINIKKGKATLAPRLKFVRDQVGFKQKTNDIIAKTVNKTNYDVEGKMYEDVKKDMMSQEPFTGSQTKNQVKPNGIAYPVLKAIAANEYSVDPRSILAAAQTLSVNDSNSIRRKIVERMQEVGVKDFVKSIFPSLQYNRVTKKSLGVNKATQSKLYQDMDLRVPNIKGKALNVDNMTDDQIKEAFGINPDFTLAKHTRSFDPILKGTVVQTSVFAFNQAAREIQNLPGAQIGISRPGSAIVKGQVDVMFSNAADVINQRSGLDVEATGVDDLLNIINKGKTTFDIKTPVGRTKFIKAIKKDLFPLFPKEFFFTFDKKGKVTSDVFTASNSNYGLSMRVPAEAKIYNKFRDNIRELGNLDDSNFGKPIKGADFSLTKTYNTIFGKKGNFKQKIKENIKNGNIKKWNNNVALIHREMWKRFNDVISKDKTGEMAQVIGTYLKLTGNDKTSWHRLGAQMVGYSSSLNIREGGKAANIEFEHAMPATAAYLYLLEAAVDKNLNFETSYETVIDNYKLIVLDKAMDDKLRNARTESGYSLQRRMPDNWSPLSNNWYERYFNNIVAAINGGIDPSSIIMLDGKSMAENFNINVDGSSRFSKPAIEIQSKQNLNDAFDNQVLFSKTGETQGLSVFDFDDTLGFTKSGVRATIPNPEGTPKPKRKVVFLAGGAGSGKGNVISKLGLEGMGFKIVNSDISLEWLKKNSGLPADMRDLTKEQRSTLGKLGAQARKIARNKMMKYQGNANGVVVDGTGGSVKTMQKLVDEFISKGYDVSMLFVDTSLDVALERNRARKERSLLDVIVRRNHEAVQNNKSSFKDMFGNRFMEVNTDNLTQQSPMPDNLVKQMDDFVSSYEKRRLDAAEFAEQGAEILEQGGTFDFSEFNDVVDGTPGPLLDKAKERSKKFGAKDIFVLTARPAASAGPIQQFLKSQGLDIPLRNITGLGNSTAEAKAEWFIQKFAEGYNDMYFADDALQNVEAVRDVLNQLDVKSDVVQAKVKFSKAMNTGFNKMIERKKGVAADKIFSEAEAKKLGKDIGRFSIYIPPSAEDFKGLLYYFLGKGKQGDKDMKFMEEALLKPFAKGIRAWNTYKQNMSNDYLNLKKAMPEVSKSINNKVPGTNFTNDSAIRVYLWDKHGFDIPGISESLKTTLVNHVKNNKDLMTFANTLSTITKRKDGYIAPGQNWSVSSIGGDLIRVVNKVGRQEFLSEWIENKDVIFSQENLNKIEAIYGTRFIEALNNILYRMENGGNRVVSKDREVNMMVNWINGAVGSIMFFNTRSALLQTLSAVNFVNFSDNNIFKATAAFANQPQFWKDFVMLFNSDQLKQRRRGLQTDVSASELTKSFKENGNSYEAVLNFLLEKGFLPTQIADSTAIAFGGASFYRNRYNKYIKEGMSAKQANEQAMLDFQEIAEETQQSSREDLVSKQQASVLGRLVLAFQNVTMQYGRLTKKALSDLVNRRGDTKTNISKIIYYGAVQNIVFASLQSALAFLIFGGSDDEPLIEDKTRRALNGALDSFLRGLGIHGALISALKNTALAWQKESELAKEGKGFTRDAKWNIAREAINLSPPIGSKVRKVVNAYSTKEYGRDISDKLKFRLENPKLQAATGVIEGLTNIPLNRLLNKANNLEEAITGQHELWQRAALIAGWNKWDIGIKDEEVEEAKEEVKVEKKEKKEEEKKQKKIEKEKIKEEEKKKEEKRKKDEGIKTLRCSGIRSNGQRCNMRGETKKKKFLCVYHKEFKDGSDTDGDGKKEYRCTATKANGQRCKNRTENENKKCYAHQ